MVPVKLTLSNFLSYGSEAQTLDFSRFHVACLSGRNGQGKSALLDALTWALWGEARKSSGAQKPDEELLRIGSRRMEVEFVFDVEGERYRVFRAYSRSATGKTSKSELEFQLIDSETEDGIPLTGASIRETQQKLTDRLGLDYDAFVNSALLLQGRSDEFTKKRPSERKNILGKVLNLGRYDRLADKARLKQNALKTETEKLEREVEIFASVLENEMEWAADSDSVTKELKDEEAKLAIIHTEEASLVEQVLALQTLEKEIQSIEKLLEQALSQKQIRHDEREQLEKKIQKASNLIQKKSSIEKDYERYVDLQKSRDELDTQRDIYRGIEMQMQSAKATLFQKRTEAEAQVSKFQVELTAKEQSYADLKLQIDSKGQLTASLEKAKQATHELERLSRKLLEQKKLDQLINELDKRITSEQHRLQARLTGLNEQAEKLKNKFVDISALEKELEKVSHQKNQFETARKSLSEVTDQGITLGEKISELSVSLNGVTTEIEKLDVLKDQLEKQVDSACPTCGNPLEEEARYKLLASFSTNKLQLGKQYEHLLKELEEKEVDRATLRGEYKRLNTKQEELASSIERFHQVNERLLKSKELRAEVEALESEISKLELVIRNESFLTEERSQLTDYRTRRNEERIDEKVIDALRFEAAQVDRYEEKLRAVLFAEGKEESLKVQIASKKKEIETLRQQLDSGESFTSLKTQIEELNKKLKQSKFDPALFEEVRSEIKRMQHVPDLMRDLVDAEKNEGEWLSSKKNLDEILGDIDEQIGGQKKRHDELTRSLGQLGVLQEKLSQKRSEKSEAESSIKQLQKMIGELNARLQQVAEAKQKRKEARAKLKEKKSQLNIYRKLRTAFGRNGIQSLIIEQALPEIEERASEILYRLTDGKMQVHLETIKDKKSGGTKETLEIIITDEQGVPRAYETYSGGEAFRINFALRIALSQMLAERNGVRVRTLGIDEGFGTQDEDGIQHLIEAIQKVQDDFDKILVITHLERLKEAFPVRIEVVKDPIRGSEVTILEQ